jgi:diaminopimelate epimerase
MRLPFTKMHGLGNDFIVFEAASATTLPDAARLRQLADRHTGIGFDQALVIGPPRREGTVAFYRIFNADGGEVEQCARLLRPGLVSVDMGVPDFDPSALPFTAPAEAARYHLQAEGEAIEFGAVSMGNPHAVLLVASVAQAPVARLGPLLESHPAFPRRVNVGFLEVVDPGHVRLRVFERGVGETLACGTGACAAVAVGRKAGRLAANVEVTLPGGVLDIAWGGPGEHIWMTGPAVVAFRGEVEL